MNLIKPAPLKKGDTIAIVAPSGAVDEKKISAAKKYFEKEGYNVILGDNIFSRYRYMAGDDTKRLNDLHNAFLNPEVNAIVCARGGYGAVRLLPQLNYALIRNNPKIFCGYSDITTLSLMILKHAGLVTYSSPMAQGDFGGKAVNSFTEKSFFNVLSGNTEIYKYKEAIQEGSSKGILWGGNLSTIVAMLGYSSNNTDTIEELLPDKKFILFIEDVGEPVYKIDKMLHQLCNNKKFTNNITGIAYGEFTGTDNEDWLKELQLEIAQKLHIPAYTGFKFTHGEEKQTIPIGLEAILDSNGITVL